MPDSQIPHHVLSALPAYDLPLLHAARLINHSENLTYRIDVAGNRTFALRIHRPSYHSLTAINSELAWAVDLRTQGVVTTPRPIRGRDGEFVQLIQSEYGPRHAVLFQWEDGTEPGIGHDLAEPFRQLGEATARMHAHARQWQRPAWFTRLTWDFETSLGDAAPHWGHWRNGIGMNGEKTALFGRTVGVIARRLAAYGKTADNFGLIHCDLRLANLLLAGTEVKVIDFDDCGFGWYMYDAATPVSFHEHEPQVPDLIEQWKEGYRRVAPIARADEAEIPTFLILRRLLLTAWIGDRAETPLAQSMGHPYTEGTSALCDAYLTRFS